SRLKAQRDARSDGDFFSWARKVAARNQGDVGALAMRFVSDTSKRRELLNHLEARHEAVILLIEREFRINPAARIILFHESITDVMGLFACLWKRGFKAIAAHTVSYLVRGGKSGWTTSARASRRSSFRRVP